MRKIIGHIGGVIKRDHATTNRDRPEYARVLIELSIDQDLPEQISFENEDEQDVDIQIHYEWKLIICTSCKGLGHTQDQCRKRVTTRWVPKQNEMKVKENGK